MDSILVCINDWGEGDLEGFVNHHLNVCYIGRTITIEVSGAPVSYGSQTRKKDGCKEKRVKK
jgi:hypothetical protein